MRMVAVAGPGVAAVATALRDPGNPDERLVFVDMSADRKMNASHGIGREGAMAMGLVRANGVDERQAAFLAEVARIAAGAGRIERRDLAERVPDERQMALHEALLPRAKRIQADGPVVREWHDDYPSG